VLQRVVSIACLMLKSGSATTVMGDRGVASAGHFYV